MDRRIDLTEHNDFGGGTDIGLPGEDTLVGLYIDNEYITKGQYEIIVRHENIFGKKRHRNEKLDVFGCSLIFLKERENCCPRCGAEIRSPWKKFYGLCDKCNEVMDNGRSFLPRKRIPWKAKENNRRNELFDLR